MNDYATALGAPWAIALLALASTPLWIGLLWLHTRFWTGRIRLRLPYAHQETLQAPDGGQCELRRITVESSSRQLNAPPVLLVHGVCANHRNQDIHPDHSVARYLAERGRDVWLLTLRCGVQPRWLGRRVPMGFDTMVRHDLPLALERIAAHTGAKSLDYVAFSMGGMLLFAALGKTIPDTSIRRAVFVGSPGRIVSHFPVPRFLRRLPTWLVPRLPSGLGARVFAFLSEWVVTPLHRQIVNPTNVASGITRLALVDCVQDVPGDLVADFIRWAADGGVIRQHGEDILHGIRQAKQPALFVAGAVDRVGPVSAVRAGYDAWGSGLPVVAKRFVVLGRESGAVADYGHGDLAMGARVHEELHPAIEEFLAVEVRVEG